MAVPSILAAGMVVRAVWLNERWAGRGRGDLDDSGVGVDRVELTSTRGTLLMDRYALCCILVRDARRKTRVMGMFYLNGIMSHLVAQGDARYRPDVVWC